MKEIDGWFSGSRERLRFAVEGPDGRFSTAWATWEKNDTIYIAGRTSGSFIKVSLHPPDKGGYRVAFTSEFYRRVKSRLPQRHIVSWQRPDPPENTAVLVASLCFPTEFLRSGPPPSSVAKKHVILEAPKAGRAANVGFFLSRAPKEALEAGFVRGGVPFVQWAFDDGISISLVAWESEFDPQVLPDPTAPVSPVALTGSGVIGPEHLSNKLTAMLINEPGPGVPLQIMELGGVSLRPHKGETSSLPSV